MKTLAPEHRWFKQITLTKADQVYVGLDVHKSSISVAICVNGRIAHAFRCSADHGPLIEKLKMLGTALKMVSYEAGPTGYSLARALQAASLPVQVISPSNTPRPSKRASKTDALDCRQLARYSSQGLLKSVTIPTEQEEAQRQLPRLRDQLVRKRRRVRQQIKSFLLQHGISQPAGLSRWSCAAVISLQELDLHSALRLSLDIYLDELAHLSSLIQRVEARLRAMTEEPSHAEALDLLTSHPGVGLVTSWAFHTEMFRPQRFQQPGQIASFLGLSPRLIQSGLTSRCGPISKSGREQLRSKLIEASWVWIQRDPKARRTYDRLCRNTGSRNKAIVGMARRLAIHLWHMLCEKEPYHPAA